jgi:hypothetical protein
LNLDMEQESLPPMLQAIQHNCARSYIWAMAALQMGVERKADVVYLQEPPIETAGIRISHSAYDVKKREGV